MKVKIAATVVLIVIGIGALAFVLAPRGQTTDATYLTAAVERGDVNDEVAATGSVATSATYGLSFGAPARLIEDDTAGPELQTTWPVAEVAVATGETVTKDQVLARADTTDLKLDLAIATAEWRAAGNDLAIARDALETAEDDGTTDEIRRARSTYYGAQSRYEQARRSRAELMDTIASAEIRSPIDGVVTAVEIEPGSDAPSGDAITVASTVLEVTTSVVEGDIADIGVGQDATVGIDALGQEIAGTVASVGLAAEDASQSGVVSYPVTIVLTETPSGLRDGMSADITIVTATAGDVLSVPTTALESGLNGYTVQVMGADGVPVARTVEVGLITESRAEITGGLDDGETVVTGTLSEQQQGQSGGFGGFGGGGGGRVIQGGPPPGGD